MLDGLMNMTLLAQGGAAAGPSLVAQLVPIGIILFIFYFLMWRPQSKRQEAHRKFVDALKKGDEVVTEGGFFGTVASVDDKSVTIEISRGTKVRVLKSSVRGTQASFLEEGKAKDEDAKDE